MKRPANVVLHGPESTGKSTLGARLAAHYGTRLIPEYGRLYCEVRGSETDADDLVSIMHGHVALTEAARDDAAAHGARLVVSDTDPLMTAAWAMMGLGHRLPALDAFTDVGDLYLLMADDIPWVDDGVRLHRTPQARARFMDLSRAELERRLVPWVLVSGDAEQRFAAAVAAIASAGIA
ncbi:MAG: ATP-binding protein [Sphingosinicella sp.]|nr:ATP-binding protein [Sphingosinicella sp.]